MGCALPLVQMGGSDVRAGFDRQTGAKILWVPHTEPGASWVGSSLYSTKVSINVWMHKLMDKWSNKLMHKWMNQNELRNESMKTKMNLSDKEGMNEAQISPKPPRQFGSWGQSLGEGQKFKSGTKLQHQSYPIWDAKRGNPVGISWAFPLWNLPGKSATHFLPLPPGPYETGAQSSLRTYPVGGELPQPQGTEGP